MAIIQHILTKKKVYLHHQHTFGRSSDNTTKVNLPDVSYKHADIYWHNHHWYLKDHSRNGTLVNKQRVHNRAIKLDKHSNIKFGKELAAEWHIVDLEAPQSYLKSFDSSEYIVLNQRSYALPNETAPEVFFLLADGRWTCKAGGSIFQPNDLYTFELNNQRWVFLSNQPAYETIDYGHIRQQAWVILKPSLNQERVHAKILIKEIEIDLGERAYNQLLLMLARQKLTDIATGIAPEEQGWIWVEQLIEQLSKEELRDVDQYNLNIRIYRLKQQLLKLPPYGSQFINLIERRKGEIRLNHGQVKIVE
ncbi:FHA domain-containing protein [Microscilla marina]|uniref:FHA domain protein, putative n=1 Tax=Microscilla marina ATCC 23134 TaxID=313606 RepID=A1ZRC1_MICM2|nr:FHA domain-containing protein [Microscilla marina]EAY27011.1 FHA domain protein, putative [Microscilla marina ATCC 23134]